MSKYRNNITPAGALIAVLIAVLLFVFTLALGGVIVLLVWNYILVPVVAYLGGSVPTITFWIALGISFLLNFVRGVFAG